MELSLLASTVRAAHALVSEELGLFDARELLMGLRVWLTVLAALAQPLLHNEASLFSSLK